MSSEVTIEIASVEDATEVSRILEASYSELMRPAYPPVELARALPLMIVANPGLLASGRYFVARNSNGSVVGCGGWSRGWPGTDNADLDPGHVRHFAVHPAWTRRGIGRRLFEACLAQAREAGVTAFDVLSALNAVDFYASLGFENAEIITLDLGGGVFLQSARMRLDNLTPV